MGWIKVKKDNKCFLITNEVYRTVFKYQGYEIVKDEFNSTQTKPTEIFAKQESPQEVKKNASQRKITNNKSSKVNI